MSTSKTVTQKVIDKYVLLVTLNRPEVSNAFNTQMARDLIELFENLAILPGETRVVVITGKGNKSFCAGADLKERKGMNSKTWQAQHLIFERMIRAVINCPIPVIGAINGAAYGGGCELVAALDFAYAAETACFAQTEVRLGIIPGIGGTQNLARSVGERRAKQLILSGEIFNAQDALTWGLVNEVCRDEHILESTLAIAKTIANNGPIAVRQAKMSIHKGLQMSLMDGLAFEIECYNRTIATEDRVEGIAAFNEKRNPIFKDQ